MKHRREYVKKQRRKAEARRQPVRVTNVSPKVTYYSDGKRYGKTEAARQMEAAWRAVAPQPPAVPPKEVLGYATHVRTVDWETIWLVAISVVLAGLIVMVCGRC